MDVNIPVRGRLLFLIISRLECFLHAHRGKKPWVLKSNLLYVILVFLVISSIKCHRHGTDTRIIWKANTISPSLPDGVFVWWVRPLYWRPPASYPKKTRWKPGLSSSSERTPCDFLFFFRFFRRFHSCSDWLLSCLKGSLDPRGWSHPKQTVKVLGFF